LKRGLSEKIQDLTLGALWLGLQMDYDLEIAADRQFSIVKIKKMDVA